MQPSPFDILGLTPADAAHPALALAMARAGALTILDLEYCRDPARAEDNLRCLLEADGRLGLRVTTRNADLADALLKLAPARSLTLVLVGFARAEAANYSSRARALFAEINTTEKPDWTPQALVAKGHEAGGWVGEDSSYILAQKLLDQTSLPVYLHGGIGLHAASASRVVGAAGIVLDDQLLLLDESPLPQKLKSSLARLNGAETRLYGEALGLPCRVFAAPGNAVLKSVEQLSRDAETGSLNTAQWRDALQAVIGWSEGALLPLGQGIGMAAAYRERYRTVGRLLEALRGAVHRGPIQAAAVNPLLPGSALAVSHGTHYPLAQGPMTRVSDSPDFACAVAANGALPFLALALMRGEPLRQMLRDTQSRIGDKPWGVGMLGFVPQALREEQCAAIWETPPPFALIAGGRPDQAAEFERRGIKTYIHAPAPSLLRLYLEQGARRFVFEGRECGGHIGPLASLPLWEQMIDVLLRDVKPGSESEIHLLFAGGIHAAQSGAMLAALTAPLVARGMKVGALMGTAYLFTREIVETGAIVQGFQDQALACKHTVSLESGPGHSTRCADTRFAQDFFELRREMIRAGRSSDEIKDSLEDLNLGRLRVASKGLDRNQAGAIVAIAPEQQASDGMYMIGQVATLREQIVGIESLHAGVCDGSQVLLDRFAPGKPKSESQPSDIAIVGIGVILPGANDAQDYWRNIVQKIVSIGEVPKSRWDADLYFDADRTARDKTYSRWGGFIDEIAFDPLRFGIPPKSMKAIDPMQLLTLEVASRALADAGCIDGNFDRGNTSIILGAGGGLGDLGLQYGLRAELPRFAGKVADEVWDRLPEWTEESFAGSLLNVAAGRVANRLDLGGVNFVVDAACASSLAAISLAVNELESGRSNMVLAGGIDTVQSPFGYISFSKTQALSPTGKPRTFDVAADGIAISEGLAVVALKRLADAERDGDRIYAVIKAAAGSSDGKALGLTAPRPEGQIRAIERTYAKAGFSPATLGLIEAHGTGTPVGDRAEAQTITGALLAERAAPRSVALGSVKTLIGHTKAGAGVAGLIKVALSLHHRVLPAHHGVETPIDAIADPAAPVHILREPRPWLKHPDHPRRGGVSAFGFGGTNFHAALEEHALGTAASGADRWPSELFLLRAVDAAALKQGIEKLLPALAAESKIDFAGLALALARALPAKGSATLAIVAANKAAFAADLQLALAHLSGEKRPLPPQIRINLATPVQSPELAFLFPGQGAQYVGMAREAALYTEEMRGALELADRRLRNELPGLLSTLILPTAAWNAETEAAQSRALTDTRIAQPAIGAVSLGYLRLAQRLGLHATAAAGHSYGEYGALMSAGVIDAEQYLNLSAVRGKAMGQASARSAPGAMAAMQASREKIEALIAGYEGLHLANHNTPEQSVISGPRAAVEQAVAAGNAQGLRASLLPVSGAFHTKLVADARAPLSAAIQSGTFRAARFPVYSNSTGRPYPAAPTAMQTQLDGHLLNSVEFVAEIEAMHAAGARVFLELGPKSVCANMVRQTLAGRDVVAVSLDGNGGGLRGLLMSLAELCVAGVAFEAAALFRGRNLATIDLSRLDALAAPATLPKHFWMVSGGNARPLHDPEHRSGKLPQLDKAGFDATEVRPVVTAPVAAVPTAMATHVSVAPALSSEALIAYQQTMRQFLALQERVVQQFLGGSAVAQPTLIPQVMPQLAAPAPVSRVRTAHDATVSPQEEVRSAHPAQDFRSLLLGIVAERTGYPEDMLGLEADLEADLGIDSIKRVEILGALRKALPEEIAAAMQTSMERYTKARSLNAILALLPGSVCTAHEAAGSQQEEVRTAHPATAEVDHRSLLLAIVAERTGYPEDMLGADADLEADLGIDSIKRVEILGALRKALPTEIASQMQAAMERYTRARSLNAILALLPSGVRSAHIATGTPHEEVRSARPTLDEEPVAATTRIPRYLIQSRPAALTNRRLPLEGTVLLLGGPDVVVTTLRALLAQQGLHTVHIPQHEAESLRRAIGQAQAAHGPARALLHLHGLVHESTDTLTQWQALSARTVLSLFHASQALADDLSNSRIIAATRLGGSFGRDATGSGSALAGGVIGLLNCLRQEEPAARMRTVDFDGQSEPQIAQMLVDELLADDDAPEAGYLISERNITVTVERPLSDSAFAPKLQAQTGWVILVTGGARGITAEIADELAVPGAYLVLLGRTVEPSQEAADTAGLEGAALRKSLIAAAQARHEKPTPAMIDRTLASLLAEREIRSNLQKLRARGAVVEYRACDVRDEARFGALIDALYEKHGRIDAVIHGAGVIEDKLLRDKTLASFDRVFGTKLDPMFVMSRKLRPESLKLFALFTSVAGRYGNRGQSDYAAANEALNRLAWAQSRAWPKVRVIAINWGPWDAGMASAAVRTQLRARGMEPIPIAAGRRMFTEELAYGNPHDVELVAGRGPWHPSAETLAAVSAAATPDLPLIRATPRMGPGGNMMLDHLFSLDSDPYLAEHRIDGKPALTLAMAREWMMQFVAAAWPGWRVAELRELRQLDDIVLTDSSRALQLRARASSHSDLEGQSVSVEILDPARKLPLCRATAILVDGSAQVQAIAEAS